MAVKGRNHSGSLNPRISEREKKHGILARRAAAEGMVLLKNEGVLPLKESAAVALFGGGAVKTVKGGTGSGDVNNRETISVYQGLKAAGVTVTSMGWIADYEKRYEAAKTAWKEKILEDVKHVDNPFDAYAENPFSLPDGRRISAEDLEGASAAIYVVGRIAGEGKDRQKAEGDYYLSKKEREDILYLDQTGMPVILLLNVGAPIELTEIMEEAENIGAILNISLPGQEGGYAAADVLLGRAAPGGRLTATWAKHYEDYPSAENFGYLNGNLNTEEYQEGIYVGYRYFDSFDIQPLFPFGYGLSYTSFLTECRGIVRTEEGIDVKVLVKNTGEHYAGREVVQVYVTPPQTGMTKEYKRLAGFAKTKILPPGEEQELTVSIEFSGFAGYSEQLHAWLAEAGVYGVWMGSHSASLQPVALLTVENQTILSRTEAIGKENAVGGGRGEAAPANNKTEEWIRAAKEQGCPEFVIVPKEEIKREYHAPCAKEQSVAELIPLLYGNITKGAGTLGSSGVRVPGSAGETTEALEEKYGIRSLIMSDGPAGIRLRQSYEVDRETDTVYGVGVLGALENGFLEETTRHENADIYYQYCTAFPVGTALAQSWDTDLMREFGEAIAVEMEEFHIDLWLAPGMNIQRNPLCGRNFEYYSEDPLLSGIMAAAVTDGVQSRKGRGVTVKHFVCNNQEDNRMGVDVRVSERALREIYLRGFEIAVKKSRPMAIMSAYNLINGIHAANNKDLCTTVVREEWGFEGVILSDWNTTVPTDGSVPWKCVAAGNDIIMPGSPKDEEDIRKAYAQGKLSEETIRCSAGRILEMIRKLLH